MKSINISCKENEYLQLLWRKNLDQPFSNYYPSYIIILFMLYVKLFTDDDSICLHPNNMFIASGQAVGHGDDAKVSPFTVMLASLQITFCVPYDFI